METLGNQKTTQILSHEWREARSEPVHRKNSGRHINLAGDSAQDAAVVSPLEAGRPLIQTVSRSTQRSVAPEAPAPEAEPETAHGNHALAAIELTPQVRTVAATSEVSGGMDYAPIAATTPNGSHVVNTK